MGRNLCAGPGVVPDDAGLRRVAQLQVQVRPRPRRRPRRRQRQRRRSENRFDLAHDDPDLFGAPDLNGPGGQRVRQRPGLQHLPGLRFGLNLLRLRSDFCYSPERKHFRKREKTIFRIGFFSR